MPSHSGSLPSIAIALQEFRRLLFQHVANPNKTELDSVEHGWRKWEMETLKHENRCSQQISHYLEVYHADRMTYETNYNQYRQNLQQARQAMEEAPLGSHNKAILAYVKTCIKPRALLKPPSTLYTSLLYNPPTTLPEPTKEEPEEEEYEEEDYEEEEYEEEEEPEEEYEEEEPEEE
jgi:hypothetical protein